MKAPKTKRIIKHFEEKKNIPEHTHNINAINHIDGGCQLIKESWTSIYRIKPSVIRFGDERITPYAEWGRKKQTSCIYCGKPADTREHVPPRTFLDYPLPDYIPTLPACKNCNNGFSKDEEYVASTIDFLKNSLFPGCRMKIKTKKRIEENSKLRKEIEGQFRIDGGVGTIKISEKNIERFERILTKLAIGHAVYQLDYIKFMNPNIQWNFIFQFNKESYISFNSLPVANIYPEVGSRSFHEIALSADGTPHYSWTEVQPDRYRYIAYTDETGINVKFVIDEFLFCHMKWDDFY